MKFTSLDGVEGEGERGRPTSPNSMEAGGGNGGDVGGGGGLESAAPGDDGGGGGGSAADRGYLKDAW